LDGWVTATASTTRLKTEVTARSKTIVFACADASAALVPKTTGALAPETRPYAAVAIAEITAPASASAGLQILAVQENTPSVHAGFVPSP